MTLVSIRQRSDGRVNEKSTSGTSHFQAPRETMDKIHALVDSNDRAVVSLRVFKSPPCPSSVPTFFENEDISGNVELNLVKPELVQEVSLSIKGTRKGLTGHSRVFIEVTEKLWNPKQTSRPDSQIGEILKGYFTWPFSLKLPSHITQHDAVPNSKTDNQFLGQLPPSFSVPSCNSSISYRLSVIIRGARNFELFYPFNYLPITRPPSLASPLGLACNQLMDEDQWEIFRAFSIRGTAFAAYSTDISCTFALPKPLCYTRGTSLLCALKLESSDENTLELLGNPHALHIQLNRYLEDMSSGLETRIARIWDAIKQPSTCVSFASWSVADIGDDQSSEILPVLRVLRESSGGSIHSKILIGRICLASDLAPSFSFGKISLKYEIQMLTFKAAGFVPEDGEKAIFFRTEIKIASAPPIPTPTRPASSSSSSLSRSSSSSEHGEPNTTFQNRNTPISHYSLSVAATAATPPFPLQYDMESPPSPRRNHVGSRSYDCDRPLPSLPPVADSSGPDPDHRDRDSNGNNDRRVGLQCRTVPSDGQIYGTSILDEERRDSRSECSCCSLLRRAVTTPRVSTTTSTTSLNRRAPFPSRQCTR